MARMTLEELIRQLQLVYGEGLACVAVYGSAARGEYLAQRSDTNVLVLVERVDMERLRREAPVARAWREQGNPPPLTLTYDEWLGSADIFPMEYADIFAYHRVVHGALPRRGIEVRREDLRLQLEHETRSKVLRLRHGVLSSGGDARAMLELLEDSVSVMLVLLRAALRLAGEEPPPSSLEVLQRVQAVTGIDVSAVRTVLLHARGERRLEPAGAVNATGAYLDATASLAQWVNGAGARGDGKGEGGADKGSGSHPAAGDTA
jgi:hypothetical protein